MPYGDLVAQRVQRFETYADLDRHETTIEEREEYEPHLDAGRLVFAGVDYEGILRAAEAECDVVIWDGGNNDLPFYAPDLMIVVADPLRPGHELSYHPGEANLRIADVVVINKIDSATPEALASVRAAIAAANPTAAVVEARSALALEGGEIRGRTVAVVEDGPTLTHGGMTYGAGIVAARRFGASEIVDPRPYATGELAATLAKYPKLEHLLPAMGYGAEADPRARVGADRDPGRRRPRGDPDRPDACPVDPQADRPRALRAGARDRQPGRGAGARHRPREGSPRRHPLTSVSCHPGPTRARCGPARSIPGRDRAREGCRCEWSSPPGSACCLPVARCCPARVSSEYDVDVENGTNLVIGIRVNGRPVAQVPGEHRGG